MHLMRWRTIVAAAFAVATVLGGSEADGKLYQRRAGRRRPKSVAQEPVDPGAKHIADRNWKAGEEHYNLISALHKSLRGSDPDAALYWLARMLAAGEDPLYIARRMIRFATEDIGNADPMALLIATQAMESYRFLGSPEGELALAQAAIYLACAEIEEEGIGRIGNPVCFCPVPGGLQVGKIGGVQLGLSNRAIPPVGIAF